MRDMPYHGNNFGKTQYSVCNTIFPADTGEQVLVDIEEKTNREIAEHIKKILGKSE